MTVITAEHEDLLLDTSETQTVRAARSNESDDGFATVQVTTKQDITGATTGNTYMSFSCNPIRLSGLKIAEALVSFKTMSIINLQGC